jgi:Flp pilus assembly protein TadG
MVLKNNKGAAAVEFAIVLPLLILILFGIIEFSVAFFDKAVITNASREGARVGMLFKSGTRNAASEDPIINSTIDNYIASNLISFGSTPVTASTTISRTGFSVGDTLTVTVSYPYSYLVIPGFITAITNPVNITATTIMRME